MGAAAVAKGSGVSISGIDDRSSGNSFAVVAKSSVAAALMAKAKPLASPPPKAGAGENSGSSALQGQPGIPAATVKSAASAMLGAPQAQSPINMMSSKASPPVDGPGSCSHGGFDRMGGSGFSASNGSSETPASKIQKFCERFDLDDRA